MSHGVRGVVWGICILLMVGVTAGVIAQQATTSDADLVRQGPLALAAAHGEKPRYGGKFLTAGNEVLPHFDMHQTSFAGIYTATAPVYNCLVRTSPYDPQALDVVPELAHSWEFSDEGKTITFHLQQGVKWHDGESFSSTDVKYTIERILNPPQGMISVRGPVFKALIERVEAPAPNTVVVYGKGPSGMLLSLFANGWNMIIPKHISEKDPVNALKTQVIGTGPFRLKEPPTPQALAAAILSKRVFWNDAFPHPNLDGDLAQSMVKQNANLVHAKVPALGIAHFSMQTEKPPFDDLRVRQALSQAIRREALAELGKQTGVVGTGNYPLGPWAMPKAMREQLIGYGPDMPKRIAHAKELLAAYEKEKGKIDWSKLKLQCSTNIPVTCENAQIIQQLLKKINVNIELEPMLVAQHRGNEVSGDYLLSTLLAGFDFDDPIDTFGQLFVSKGGRWYQRHSVPELDKLFEQQKFLTNPVARKEVVWEMDKIAMHQAAFLILHWVDLHHVRWNFVKGWTATPNPRSTNPRLDYVWLDLPELPHSR
jgi:peptide/nickel transport system substrate-binding protein